MWDVHGGCQGNSLGTSTGSGPSPHPTRLVPPAEQRGASERAARKRARAAEVTPFDFGIQIGTVIDDNEGRPFPRGKGDDEGGASQQGEWHGGVGGGRCWQ